MAQVTININGREYGIACDDGDEGHIIRLARVLDQKAKLLTSAGGHINENQLLAMVGLLMADELEDIKKGVAPAVRPEPVIQTVEVEKVVEKIVEKEPDFEPIDRQLSEKLNSVADEIKSVANLIETW